MKDRIRQIMESKHMTQQAFAGYIGMSPAALSSIFNERTRPTLNTVEAIMNRMPEIDVTWLISGKGDMYKSSPSADGPTDSGDAKPRQHHFITDDEGNPIAPALPGLSPTDLFVNRQLTTSPAPAQERPARKITEIRVFFDDQTYESFVPRK